MLLQVLSQPTVEESAQALPLLLLLGGWLNPAGQLGNVPVLMDWEQPPALIPRVGQGLGRRNQEWGCNTPELAWARAGRAEAIAQTPAESWGVQTLFIAISAKKAVPRAMETLLFLPPWGAGMVLLPAELGYTSSRTKKNDGELFLWAEDLMSSLTS